MPVVLGSEPKKPASAKAAAAASGEKKPPIMAIIAGAFLVIVFMVFMYNRAFNSTPGQGKMPEKVPPLPGFADQYPYNTKEWQEHYKKTGQGLFLSGVPRHMINGQMQGGGPAQSGQGETGAAQGAQPTGAPN